MNNTPIINKKQLISYIESGFKNKKDFKIGSEFESFLYHKKGITPVNFLTISDILNSFDSNKWQKVIEDNQTIALVSDEGNISLEPAGQIEFSNNPCKDIYQQTQFINNYFKELLSILEKKDIGIFNLGYNPKFSLEELPLNDKTRYQIMYNYMPKVGTLGRKMMKKTATLQTNLDYSDEEDLIKKVQVSMKIQPVITAIFANSPISKGKLTGNLSHRMSIWQDTDNNRSGLLDFVFKEDFSIEKYVDYALNVPMYFVIRDKKYFDINHITFNEFLHKKNPYNLEPNVEDFINHLNTLFPDVRIKTYIEMRGADCPDSNYLNCLSSLFIGLLYDDTSLENIFQYTKDWQYQEIKQLQLDIIKSGFNVNFRNQSIKEVILEIITIAKEGLQKRNNNEEICLNKLISLVNENKTFAEKKIELFNSLNQNVDEFIKAITIKNIPTCCIDFQK